jgi:predicted lipid-binding transport protein (Tim44 family)
MNVSAPQEKAMDIRKSPESERDATRTATPGAFRIRYGRTGLALLGLAALLTGFVSGALLLFGLGTPLLPVWCLAAFVTSVVVLRWLAVRDRKAKVNAAFSAAMAAPSRRPESAPARPATPAHQPESPLFDAEAHRPKVKPLTAVELREAALAVAAAAGDTSVRSAALPPAGETWQPVDVPKPVYVEAAKAERPAPEPLDLPEAPKAVGKPSLKQAVPAAPAAAPARPLTKAQSALSNLDDVLQRRRA